MSTTITLAGFTLTVAAIIIAVAAVQFVLMATTTLLSKEKLPKKGMRSADRRLAISAGVLALAWTAVFAANNDGSKGSHVEAGLAGSRVHASCSSIEAGMSDDVTQAKMGKPDEIRSDEETRGPGAKIWIYRDSRCAVHMLDDRVEFID